MKTQDKIVVVGGGPVGALAALYSAKRGYEVEVYELRDDPLSVSTARSGLSLIPVTLSERGFRAIEGSGIPGLVKDVLDHSVPVHSRMVHSRDEYGRLTATPMPYSPKGDCLHVIPRTNIRERLLSALRKEPNARVFFNQKLVACDLDSKTAIFASIGCQSSLGGENVASADGSEADRPRSEPRITVGFNYLIGADGAHSNIRQHMIRQLNMDYEQKFIDVLWCGFYIPPNSVGSYRLDPANLHVWPNKDCVFVAMPDIDGSLRGGMIAPTHEFHRLEQHPEELETFFVTKYPGIIPDLISVEAVKEQFLRKEHLSLVSIKCGEFGYGDSCVLLGDSSHTMVPFYGMGMNTGLEDVRIFFEEFIDVAHRKRSISAFCHPGVTEAYTKYRLPDVQAMTDIARQHFNELKTGVPSKTHMTRNLIESSLHKHVPALGFVPFYSRIVFGHERFSVAKKKDDLQKFLFNTFLRSVCLVSLLSIALHAIF